MGQLIRVIRFTLLRVVWKSYRNEVFLPQVVNAENNVFLKSFMGNSPFWYKELILVFLIINPILYYFTDATFVAWVMLTEFIITLALALKCYPLLPGGLIAIEAVFMGLVTPEGVYHEVAANLQVILLLLFMVAGIHFMKDLLSWLFTKILTGIGSKVWLSLTFCVLGAGLSAWLDALTVTAVMITVVYTFYNIYVQAELKERVPGNLSEEDRKTLAREDLDEFDSFLRNLMMHGLVGTAIGGVCTLVGEPQNLIIAQKMGWSFKEFYLQMAHVTIPVIVFGFATTIFVEKFKIAGYGAQLPERVGAILKNAAMESEKEMNGAKKYQLWVQGIAALWVVFGLAFHLAEVGLIGLSVIIFLAIFTGKSSEHVIGQAFQEATPFASLLIVFFVIVGMVQHTGMFEPIIHAALAQEGDNQTYFFFFASGLLSAISDNVFVATIYIQQAIDALQHNREQLEKIAVAINIGTNIPSIATPNGQAAFLFLLTNVLAAKIQLSYFKMVKMAIPYLIVLTLVAALFLTFDWLDFLN